MIDDVKANIKAIEIELASGSDTQGLQQSLAWLAEKATRIQKRETKTDTTIGVAIVGPGLIGATLIDQIKDQCEQLHREFGIDIRVLAIASSKKMILSEKGINLTKWREEFEGPKSEACDLKKLGVPVCESYLLLCETLSDDFQLPMQLPSLWHTPLTLPDYLSLLELYSLSLSLDCCLRNSLCC